MIPRVSVPHRRRTKHERLSPLPFHPLSSQPASGLSLFWLGAPRIEYGQAQVEFESRKALALLSYLTVTNERHTRDALTTLFWPELDHAHARAALRNILWLIKKALGEEWLDIEREALCLRRQAGLWTDVDYFRRQLAECRTHGHPADEVCPACLVPLTEAATVYQADFLTGFTLADSPSFDEWQLLQTQRLRHELLGVLEQLVRYHCRQEEYETAITYAQRWLALDPLHESAHRQLMQLYAQTGQRPAALRQYQVCAQVLKQEVGALPQPETVQLYQALQANHVSPSSDMAARPITVPRHSLPLQPTPFVGRKKEVAEIVRLLGEPTCRLLTLLGPGGMGKTRLALQVAAEKQRFFAQGICFVPLASLSSADFLVAAIAAALGFSFHDQQSSRTQLFDYLREKELLLILDNFEHLCTGADLLSEILQRAPRIKLLVTSRERLNLHWERLLDIEGLEFPGKASKTRIGDYSAVQLFVQNAGRVRPDFSLREEDWPFVAQICRQVAGMPLALELASAWVRTLSCQEIAEEIRRDFSFLTSALRDIPERHRSLHTVFEHSWSLLSVEEKNILSRLAVFRGGFCLEAASQVAGATPLILSGLIDKSFLRRLPQARYYLLEVLRQYALEKLQETDQTEAIIRDLHSGYYAEFLRRREHDLQGQTRQEALTEIGEEIENIQAGWGWASEQGQLETIAKSLECLYLFYEAQGWQQAGEVVFHSAAAKIAELKAGVKKNLILGQLLAREGVFAQQAVFFDRHRAYGKAAELLQASLALFRQNDNHQEIAFTLTHLGFVRGETGDLQTAQQLCQEGLALYREMGDPSGIAQSLKNLGNIAYHRGEYVAAQGLWQQSLELFREIGDHLGTARTLNNLGLTVGYLEEEPTVIKSLFREMHAVSKACGAKILIAFSLMNLGECAYQQREYAGAKQLYEEGRAIFQELGHRGGIAFSLINLGRLVYRQGQYGEAQQLCQESLIIFEEIGDRWGASVSRNLLGMVSSARGEYQVARQCFQEVLKTAIDLRAAPLILDSILGVAVLLAKEGQQAQALDFLVLIQPHPTNDWLIRYDVQQLAGELESQLPSTIVADAHKRREGRSLAEAAEIVLAFLNTDP